ncbi:TetR/AcrR family transcriptional regulator [Brucellaceae bacterium C25G]
MVEVATHVSGRPSKAQMIKTTSTVLDTAKDFFSTRGFSGASMDEIAAHSGITKRTIYRRYPSKHALLEAVVEREIQLFLQWLEGAELGQTSIEHLKNTAFRVFEYITSRDNTRFICFLVAEGSFSKDMEAKVIEWEEVSFAPILTLISACQRDGYLAPADKNELGYLLMDLINAGNHVRNLNNLIKGGLTAQSAFFNKRWNIFVDASGTSVITGHPEKIRSSAQSS